MSKIIICDACGEKDDWGNPPFFPDGVVLQFRGDDGGREIYAELELCAGCKSDLLKALPGLAATLEKRDG